MRIIKSFLKIVISFKLALIREVYSQLKDSVMI